MTQIFTDIELSFFKKYPVWKSVKSPHNQLMNMPWQPTHFDINPRKVSCVNSSVRTEIFSLLTAAPSHGAAC